MKISVKFMTFFVSAILVASLSLSNVWAQSAVVNRESFIMDPSKDLNWLVQFNTSVTTVLNAATVLSETTLPAIEQDISDMLAAATPESTGCPANERLVWDKGLNKWDCRLDTSKQFEISYDWKENGYGACQPNNKKYMAYVCKGASGDVVNDQFCELTKKKSTLPPKPQNCNN